MVKAVTAAYCAREDGSVQRRWDSALWPRVCNDVRANEREREVALRPGKGFLNGARNETEAR